MSQATNWSVPLSGPVPPDEMADRMDQSFDALLSAHSGASRPSYAVAGTIWISTATAGKLKKYVFDGAGDRLIETIDIATGAVTYSNGTVDDVLATKAPKSVYATKSGAYTALASDNGAKIRFTAAATLGLTAAATLGNGWEVDVIANGGAVTIDPNGSETINGRATLIVPDGCTATIVCDGTGFFTIIKPTAWEVVPDGFRSFSGVSAVDFPNLGAYARLRLSGRITLSANGVLGWRSSTNNGSSYDAGASDYSFQGFTAIDSTLAGSRTTAASYGLLASGTSVTINGALFNDFNVSGAGCVSAANSTCFNGGVATIFERQDGAFRNDSTARNALRIIPTTALTLTGTLLLEGSVS